MPESFEPGAAMYDSEPPSEVHSKEEIAQQLDVFTNERKIPSLQDRLRIGLNEVAILAYEKTNKRVHKMLEALTGSEEEAERVYQDLVDVSIDIQLRGPWNYKDELLDPKSDAMKAWFILAGAETIGYEREMDLNDSEFAKDVMRIEQNLQEAAKDPEAFLKLAKNSLVEKSKSAIRFDKKEDPKKKAPIGEGFATFLPMALQGYEAGVVQDAQSWVYVGAKGEVPDDLVESIGLKAKKEPDDRDPNRMVTYYYNDQGQALIKKVHPGLLVMLTKNFNLARSVAMAMNLRADVIKIADEHLTPTRVIQSTEKIREELGMTEETMPKEFLRFEQENQLDIPPSQETAIASMREDFYPRIFYVRTMYVYTDKLRQYTKKLRDEEGREPTEYEKKVLFQETYKKMNQKAEELRYANAILDRELEDMPKDISEVIDMAGGAGDLGLAVANELITLGRDVKHVEIVDPQEGTDEFMETIINYLPNRDKLEEIAEHNTGYLQDAKIHPESLVVAKHACGVLADEVFEGWRHSGSKMLVAMTCCQGKAADQPARYGFSQQEWHDVCVASEATNTKIPEIPGKAQDIEKKKLEKGMRAMKKLDMARVRYLRRHGFKAELTTTDKFPKGDVIVARRLPENFMKKLEELEHLEKTNPGAFENAIRQFDFKAAGAEAPALDMSQFEGWIQDDFAEMGRRFIAPAYDEYKTIQEQLDEEAARIEEEKKEALRLRQKELMNTVFDDVGGKINVYINNRAKAAGKKVQPKEIGKMVGVIKSRMFRDENETAEQIRVAIDEMMADMGY